MANSKIWFYPGTSSTSGLVEIDFGEIISDVQITPYRVVNDAVSIGGAFSRVSRRSGMKVRIVNERFTDTTLAEKLYSLQSHLTAGGAMSFAVDGNDHYAAFKGITTADPGKTVFPTMSAPLFDAYGEVLPANGDGLHIESFGAGSRYEENVVQAYTSSARTLTLKRGLMYGHTNPMLVRHRDFFPALYLPEDAMGTPIITSDHRITYTFDATFECYPAHLVELYGKEGSSGLDLWGEQGGSMAGGKESTLDEMIKSPIDIAAEGIIAGAEGSDTGPRPTHKTATETSTESPLDKARRAWEFLG